MDNGFTVESRFCVGKCVFIKEKQPTNLLPDHQCTHTHTHTHTHKHTQMPLPAPYGRTQSPRASMSKTPFQLRRRDGHRYRCTYVYKCDLPLLTLLCIMLLYGFANAHQRSGNEQCYTREHVICEQPNKSTIIERGPSTH